jgi:hypothetical protein
MKIKRYFYMFIHLNFITGLLYAFWHFLDTPKSIMETRRLWAYESWIIGSLYCLFVYLIIKDSERRIKLKIKMGWFKEVVLINLILLIFPWGLFLLLAPKEMMSMLMLGSVYWRILGGMSLVGALIYYFPFRFYKNKWSFFIMIFGFVDNFLAGGIIVWLFLNKRVPLMAFMSTPLLFYFSVFFLYEARRWKKLYGKK